MKTTLLLFVIFFIAGMHSSAQIIPVPARGEVYDYEIDDQFHYFKSQENICLPFSLRRLKVISKSFSVELDTVFYTFHQERLSTQPVEPFETYSVDTIFVSYTNLQDSILSIVIPDSTECSNVSETDWCNFKEFNYSFTSNCNDLGSYTTYASYGYGLGRIIDGYVSSEERGSSEELIFVAKGKALDQRCGKADWRISANTGTTNLEESLIEDFIIYPNPTAGFVWVGSETLFDRILCFDERGNSIELRQEAMNSINVSYLTAGKYILVFVKDKAFTSKAFVKI